MAYTFFRRMVKRVPYGQIWWEIIYNPEFEKWYKTKQKNQYENPKSHYLPEHDIFSSHNHGWRKHHESMIFQSKEVAVQWSLCRSPVHFLLWLPLHTGQESHLPDRQIFSVNQAPETGWPDWVGTCCPGYRSNQCAAVKLQLRHDLRRKTAVRPMWYGDWRQKGWTQTWN